MIPRTVASCLVLSTKFQTLQRCVTIRGSSLSTILHPSDPPSRQHKICPIDARTYKRTGNCRRNDLKAPLQVHCQSTTSTLPKYYKVLHCQSAVCTAIGNNISTAEPPLLKPFPFNAQYIAEEQQQDYNDTTTQPPG